MLPLIIMLVLTGIAKDRRWGALKRYSQLKGNQSPLLPLLLPGLAEQNWTEFMEGGIPFIVLSEKTPPLCAPHSVWG